MADQRNLRSATLEILAARDERTIGIGTLVDALQRRGHARLQTLWNELDTMERERLIQSSGPPARRTIHLVVGQSRAPTRSQDSTTDELPELEDPATFFAQAPAAPPEPEASTVIAELVPAVTPAPVDDAPAGTHAPVSAAASVVPAEPAANVPLIAPKRRRGGRPAPEKRTTRFKGLTRCDYPERSMVGYMVRVNWNGQRRQAFFSDKKYGDRLAALDAALQWRNKTEAELGKPRTEQQVIGKTTSNTGVQGVTRILREGHPTLQVTWYENGRQRRRTVNIDRYGEAKALTLAKKIRAEAERRRLGGEAFALIRQRDR